MNLRRWIEQILLAGVIGGLSMSVKYIARMSENLEHMTVAIQLLTEKIGNIDRLAQDHEARIRTLERRR